MAGSARASVVLFQRRAEGARAGRGPRRVLHLDRGARRARATTTRSRRSTRSRRCSAPLTGDGQADPARQHARAGRLRRQRGHEHRPGDRLPAGLGQARRDDRARSSSRCAASSPRSRAIRATPRSCAPASSAATASRCRSCSAARTTRRSPAGATAMLARMAENPGMLDADSDYKETRPQMRVEINFERAADLGVSTEEIGTHARDDDGLAAGHDFRRGRRGVRRRAAGRAPTTAPRPRTSRTSTCARAAAASSCRCPRS